MSHWKIVPGVSLYFVTTTIVDWQFVFTSFPYFEIIIDALKYSVAKKGLHLHAYVIMPNHAHYIISADIPENVSHIMRDFNTHTSREITALLREERKIPALDLFKRAAALDGRGNDFKVWQDGFHPIALETEGFIEQKLDYLHDNPVRKGYVEEPEHWKYSSARNYVLNDHSVIRVECLL
ncbi:MAG: transposase [Ignavibacteriales bacterium]|nr:transposase [Ignavibacteriales bacterium]